MKKQKQFSNRIYVLSFLVLGLLFFNFVGQQGYLEMRDTAGYKTPGIEQGIMPLYPLFLNLIHLVCGNAYLTVAAFIQGIIAAVCLTVFVYQIVTLFRLQKAEGYLLWIACLLPFSIELPDYVITHMIYSESLSYACYYLYVLCLLYAVVLRSGKWLCITFGTSLFMSLIRPQLLLLFIVWALAVMYINLTVGSKKLWSFMKSLPVMAVGIVMGVVLTYSIRGFYVTTLDIMFIDRFVAAEENNVATEEIKSETDENQQQDEALASTDKSAIMRANTAQIGSALIVRGFFEADSEDIKYYKTEEMQDIFARTYEKCDKMGYSYRYAGSGLWMWEDLTKPYIYDEVDEAISEYCNENNTNEPYANQNKIKLQLGITEILVHPVRFLYHSFRLMIPGFISCVFFNIESVYLLCHIITLFLYLSALTMAIITIRNAKCDSRTGVFMLMVVLGCLVFVGVTNMLFYGMQRYFLYQIGIFYCAYYLVFRQMGMLFAQTQAGSKIVSKISRKR